MTEEYCIINRRCWCFGNLILKLIYAFCITGKSFDISFKLITQENVIKINSRYNLYELLSIDFSFCKFCLSIQNVRRKLTFSVDAKSEKYGIVRIGFDKENLLK